MIIYYSESRIQNLLKEIEIKPNAFCSIFNFRLKGFHFGNESSHLSTDLSYEKSQREREYSKVLNTLKLNGKLKKLSPNTPIKQLSYIHSSGIMEYVKFENGITASTLSKNDLDRVRSDDQFFDDDMLYFKIKISHEQYDSITIKCTVANIEVFGGQNLSFRYSDLFKKDSTWIKYPASGDPGILYRRVPVDFFVWILDTDPNDRSIEGSPLIVCC